MKINFKNGNSCSISDDHEIKMNSLSKPGEYYPIEKVEKEGDTVYTSYLPTETKFDFTGAGKNKIYTITNIHEKYTDCFYDVILKLVTQIVKREPISEDVKRLHLKPNNIDKEATLIFWDETYIGIIKPGHPQLCGYHFNYPSVIFTPSK